MKTACAGGFSKGNWRFERSFLLKAVTSLAALAFAPLSTFAQEPVISSLVVTNVTLTSAEVDWTTDVPATSQVILLDASGNPLRRYPEPQDSTLTTTHQVVLSNLIPASTYTFEVASFDSNNDLNTTGGTPGTFTTLTQDPNAQFDFRIDATGAKNVYVGSNLNVGLSVVLLGGTLNWIVVDGTSIAPSGVTAVPWCYYMSQNWCYPDSPTQSSLSLNLSVPSNAPLGATTAGLTLTINGVTKQLSYDFTVLPLPDPVVKQPITSVPAIPNLQTWQNQMVYLGHLWCNPNEVMSWGWEQDVWYYDGGRTYFQIADYTQDPTTWYPCAFNIINQYRDHLLSQGGYIQGWRVYPHGLAMSYWRTGDPLAQQAEFLMSQSSAFAGSGGSIYPAYIRETAYAIDMYVKAEQLGAPRNPLLPASVDYALQICDQLFVSDTAQFNQPFFDGLMAEALIQYYGLTGDTRIPPVIKTMLDWLWQNAYSSNVHALAYDTLAVPVSYDSELSNMVLPAFAWYWQLTGDPTYQERADDLFAHAFDTDISYNAKIFNENFRWSFDYVRWRSNLSTSTTDPSTNTPNAVATAQDPGPVVGAGGDVGISFPVNSVLLRGTARGTGASIVAVAWTEVSGPGTVTFSTPSEVSTTATFPAPGVYIVQLTASDRYKSASSTATVTVGAAWYGAAWQYRKQVGVDHTKVSEPLSGFPVLVSVTDPDLRSVSQGGMVASESGTDLVFTDGGNAVVPYEVELYDPVAGKLVAWVRCDLSTVVDVSLYLYFGNAAAASSLQNSGAVWDSNYRGVWHLSEGAGAAQYKDSSGNGNDGVGVGEVAPALGVVAGGQRFDGHSYVEIDGSGPICVGNNFTWEAWVNDDYNVGTVVSQAGLPSLPSTVWLYGGSVQGVMRGWGVVASTDLNLISPGQWYHIAYTRNGEGEANAIYINGLPIPLTLNGSTPNFNFQNASGPTYIGADSIFQDLIFGVLDEVRLSATARSPGWIATEFANQSAPGAFARVFPTQALSNQALSAQRVAAVAARAAAGDVVVGFYGSSAFTHSGGYTASDPAVAEDANGNVFTAVLDANGAAWVKIFYASSHTWSPHWIPLGGHFQGTPALAVATDGTAYVAARDTWNLYWMISYSTVGGPGAWIPVWGSLSTDPAVAAAPDGSIYVVGVDFYGLLWSRQYIPGQGLQAWTCGGSQVHGKPAVTVGADNVVYVAFRDSWNNLYIETLEGGTWLGWSHAGGSLGQDPKVAAGGDGVVYSVILDAWGYPWVIGLTEGTSSGWQGWRMFGHVPLNSLAAAALGTGGFEAVGLDAANTVWWYRSTDQSWTSVGSLSTTGALAAAPN